MVCGAWGGGVLQDVRGTRRGGYNMINMESFSIYFCFRSNSSIRPKKIICGFPVSSYKNLGRVGRF